MERNDSTCPVRDSGVNREFPDKDIDNIVADHRQAMYIGLRLPKRPRRPVKKSRSKKQGDKVAPSGGNVSVPVYLSPSEQIQNLLGEVEDEEHVTHDVFCQMDNLQNSNGDYHWSEAARWVKYEEDVEEGGERWSKPHVASLSLHSLFELRSCMMSGAVMLDMDAHNLSQVIDLLLDNLINCKLLEECMRDKIRSTVVRPHVHQHTKRKKSTIPTNDDQRFRKTVKRTFSEIGRQFSGNFKGSSHSTLAPTKPDSLLKGINSSPNIEMMNGGLPESASSLKLNEQFMKKIPTGAEVANILVGEIDSLKYQVTAFIRLQHPRLMDMAEVPLPTRFVFFCLGPPGSHGKVYEIGRSISTIMVDEVFGEVAYKARGRQDLLAGIDEFLDQVTVLPPGEWDPNIRIEPPAVVPPQGNRKSVKPTSVCPKQDEDEELSHCDPTLVRTGSLFGGLIADVKRKVKWYASDFKDALHLQCIASIIFLYLATLTPNVTFGGLLGQATDQYMGTMECILTAAITGVAYALFSGQPLNILGSTGPMLVLEMILYSFCKERDLDFLPLRCWIGLWTTLILLLVVAFDLSALVRYITRFTEESFACLIAIIFIAEAFKKIIGINDDYKLHTNVPDTGVECMCLLLPSNTANSTANNTASNITNNIESNFSLPFDNITDTIPIDNEFTKLNCSSIGGIITGDCVFMPDVFLLSILLFIGTFTIANTLQSFKTSRFFPTWVRHNLSDFSVLISIIIMVGIDMLLGIPTPKLEVPKKFKPTRSDRDWFINPISDKNPWWMILACCIPALLAVILIFMDQQITAVIVNRKENKLRKGNGYHLDLFIVAICIAICSVLGLPWYVAATVSALAHIMSLKRESECTAPGERPAFLGVREQRVTALMVGLLSGLSVLFTSVLSVIPMAVLYGVFLYMGVAALKGMQYVDRFLLLFMPTKYQPDHIYLRHVPTKTVHLFTLCQTLCLIILWVIKTIKSVSIVFPIMVLATCFVRKALDYVFTQRELKWLDDIMPDASTREKEDLEIMNNEETEEGVQLLSRDENEKLMEVRIQHEKPSEKFASHLSSNDLDRVNISEEVNKTAIWLQVRNEKENAPLNSKSSGSSRRKRKSKDKDKHSKDAKDGEVKPHEPKAVDFYIQEADDPESESKM
ncbi:electroneutral sodium bicarbonate exchanger 1-like isoform X1 [Octopus vulgaris]|uniref:Anion exchange protein n=1 Tax=Octopus vulgaris TaxID=6645 RepID=A0AA36AUU2_OCTVU|nr:electroneutral sodium bicarbonate exchanger 1-like isoform X1 [Octopus vulgaris]